MNWLLSGMGILVMLLGIGIWRFKLFNLLSNVDKTRVIDKGKAARLAGCYLILLGTCFFLFGYVVQALSDTAVVLIIACFIPVNMIFVVTYLVAQSRNMR
jgi:hypothetical protein